MSIPNWVPRASRRQFSELGNRAKAALRLERGCDADTLRLRALHDARGQQLREGRTYSAAGVIHWRVIRSLHGRTDQRDVLVNNELFRTCGPRRLPIWLR